MLCGYKHTNIERRKKTHHITYWLTFSSSCRSSPLNGSDFLTHLITLPLLHPSSTTLEHHPSNKRQTVTSGEDTELSVRFESKEKVTIVWRYEKRVISSSSNYSILTDSSSTTLRISKATKTVAGLYTVEVSNSKGTKIFQTQLTVKGIITITTCDLSRVLSSHFSSSVFRRIPPLVSCSISSRLMSSFYDSRSPWLTVFLLLSLSPSFSILSFELFCCSVYLCSQFFLLIPSASRKRSSQT